MRRGGSSGKLRRLRLGGVDRHRPALLRDQIEPDLDLGALVDAGARGAHAAAVHLDDLPHQREPDAEPAVGAVEGAVDLGEEVEDVAQHLRRNADPVVAHRDHRLVLLGMELEPDAPAFRGVLGGVVEEVADHLGQAGGVALHLERARRQRHHQLLAARVDQRPRGLDRARDHRGEVDRLALQRDLAARDARDVEQVVDQPRQLVDLALDDVARARALLVGQLLEPHQLHRVADRRQRVAQLVRQHGQELVLAAVGLAELLLALAQARGRGLELGGALARRGSRARG